MKGSIKAGIQEYISHLPSISQITDVLLIIVVVVVLLGTVLKSIPVLQAGILLAFIGFLISLFDRGDIT